MDDYKRSWDCLKYWIKRMMEDVQEAPKNDVRIGKIQAFDEVLEFIEELEMQMTIDETKDMYLD